MLRNLISRNGRRLPPRYLILQIGNDRSVIEDTKNKKKYIINNTHLMLMDELGNIL